MSVRIDIGPYRLESYSAGWTIGEPRVRTDGEGAGEELFGPPEVPGLSYKCSHGSPGHLAT